MKQQLYVGGLLLLMPFVTAVSADTLYFKNGDQLQGKLVAMQGGVMTFESKVLGTLSIDMSSIRSFSTEEANELHFDDGTVLKQSVQAATGNEIAVETQETAVVTGKPVSLARLSVINPAPKPEPEWKGKVTAGLNFERGNTSRDDSHLDIAMTKESEQDRIRLSAEYDENREKDQDTGEKSTSKRRYALQANYDYFLGDNYYVYGNTKAEKETTANLDLRFNIGMGGGYRWLNTLKTKFETEAGIGWVNETFSDDTDDNSYVSLRLAWNYDYKISDSSNFFHKAEWLPSLEDTEDQLVSSETGIRTQINSRLALEAKIKHRWDQTPADDNDKQDTSYIFGLGWSF